MSAKDDFIMLASTHEPQFVSNPGNSYAIFVILHAWADISLEVYQQ